MMLAKNGVLYLSTCSCIHLLQFVWENLKSLLMDSSIWDGWNWGKTHCGNHAEYKPINSLYNLFSWTPENKKHLLWILDLNVYTCAHKMIYTLIDIYITRAPLRCAPVTCATRRRRSFTPPWPWKCDQRKHKKPWFRRCWNGEMRVC